MIGLNNRITYIVITILLVTIGVARIVSTYSIFTQTTDEPAHIASGLEWLDRGTYIYEPHHPPLSRIASAIGPYLYGSRLTEAQRKYLDEVPEDFRDKYGTSYYHNLYREMWDTGNDILYNSGSYFRTLSLARMGTLPFFILAAFLTWLWCRNLYNNTTALIATAIFTTLPPVLAHAGLATTDMAMTAMFLFSIIAFTSWLKRPTAINSLIFGVAGGLAILSKFSSLLFFPACAIAILLWRWLILVRQESPSHHLALFDRKRIKLLVMASISAFLVIWSGYQFSVGAIKPSSSRPHEAIDSRLGNQGLLHDVAYKFVEAPIIPARELVDGIIQISQHNQSGHRSYLLGEVRQTGWWYFFPVALSVKVPIPVLLLTIIGLLYTIAISLKANNWLLFVPVLSASAILLATMISNINIGIRHILPIFPFVSIIAAYGAVSLWNSKIKPLLLKILVISLGIWLLNSTIQSHPDYLAYFNEFASAHPEKVIIDSDLDWGQDLQRLSNYLRKAGIKKIAIAYQGTADITKHGLPAIKVLAPNEQTTGWVAASIFKIKVRPGYAWLDNYEPHALIGKSIRLYYIPEL